MTKSVSFIFNDPTQYSFDPALFTIGNGSAKLKSQQPVDMTFFASYINNQNADIALGDPTGTLKGSAFMANGFLNISGSTDG